MTGNLQPLDQQFAIVDASGRPTQYFIRWAQQRQIDIGNGVDADQAAAIVAQFCADHPLQQGSGIQITPDGNLTHSPTITAQVQAILDQITTTRGSVLYRGAAGWGALAPGTSGYFLKTNGAGADPAWAAPGGGGATAFAPGVIQMATVRSQAVANTNITLPAAPTVGNLLILIWTGAGAGNRALPTTSFRIVDGIAQASAIAQGGNMAAAINQGCWMAVRRVQTGDTATFNTGSLATDNHNYALIEVADADIFWVDFVNPQMNTTTAWTATKRKRPHPSLRFFVVESDTTVLPGIAAATGLTVITPDFGATANNHRAALAQLTTAFDADVSGTFTGAPTNPMAAWITIAKSL